MAVAVILSGCTTPSSTDNSQVPSPGSPTTPTPATAPATAPQVFAAFGPVNPLVGEAVSFDASSSKAGAKSITGVAWTFGDGDTGTGLTASHAYTSPGDYVVLVKVTNDAGLTATNDRNLLYVSVAPPAVTASSSLDHAHPVAKIAADGQLVKKGTTVAFSGATSHGWAANPDYKPELTVAGSNTPISPDTAAIAEYAWDFGDGEKMAGNASVAKAVEHTFPTAGLYTVTLTVKDANGESGSAGFSVLVEEEQPVLSSAPNKDVFVTATISGPKSVDPGYMYDDASATLVQNVGEPLFHYDGANVNKLLPLLAAEVPSVENGGVKNGGLTYLIKVRPGVKFHDGTPLTAEAVKFSLDRVILMKDPNNCGVVVLADIIKGAKEFLESDGTKADRAAYLAAGGIKVVDPMTVELNLPALNAATFPRLAFHCAVIVSPTAYKAPHEERVALWGVATTPDGLPPAPAEKGERLITRDPWADLNIVGTGAFTIRKWLPNDRVIFDRFDGYWGEKPKLKTVIVQYVDDLNTRVLMLKSGAADEIYVGIRDVDNVRPQLASVANFVPSQTLIIRQAAFTFRMDDSGANKCPTDKDGTPDCEFFADKHMRAAFSYAFDYDSFIKNVLKGSGFRSTGAIPRGMPGFNPEFKGIEHDMEKAKAELAMSKHPNGFSVECYYNTGNTARKAACEMIKQQMETIGQQVGASISVSVKDLKFDVLTDLEQKHQVPLALIGWLPDYIATDDFTVPYYASNGYFPASFLYKNESIDKRIEVAKSETDPQKQAKMWQEINEDVVMNDMPYIFLSQDGQIHIERTWVRGYYYNPIVAGQPNSGLYKHMSKV